MKVSMDKVHHGITKFIGDTKEEIAYKDNVNMMCKIHPENYAEKPAEKPSEKKEDNTQTDDKGEK